MAYIRVKPKTAKAQKRLARNFPAAEAILKNAVAKTWKRPAKDIICELHRCEVVIPDKKAKRLKVYPDAVIKISTSDKLQRKATALRTKILKDWAKNEKLSSIKIEVWIEFFHTWGTNIEL